MQDKSIPLHLKNSVLVQGVFYVSKKYGNKLTFILLLKFSNNGKIGEKLCSNVYQMAIFCHFVEIFFIFRDRCVAELEKLGSLQNNLGKNQDFTKFLLLNNSEIINATKVKIAGINIIFFYFPLQI